MGLIYLLANTIQTNYRDSVKNQDGCYLGLYHLVANGRIGDRLFGGDDDDDGADRRCYGRIAVTMVGKELLDSTLNAASL